MADDLVWPSAQRFQIEEILLGSLQKALNRRLKALNIEQSN
ncbi:MAG: hypothetical protein R2856_14635 [Caldilineaceae bacterium]